MKRGGEDKQIDVLACTDAAKTLSDALGTGLPVNLRENVLLVAAATKLRSNLNVCRMNAFEYVCVAYVSWCSVCP